MPLPILPAAPTTATFLNRVSRSMSEGLSSIKVC